jgi:acetylornithine/succinyldiaminopimelate/putrescine aminotransferase
MQLFCSQNRGTYCILAFKARCFAIAPYFLLAVHVDGVEVKPKTENSWRVVSPLIVDQRAILSMVRSIEAALLEAHLHD